MLATALHTRKKSSIPLLQKGKLNIYSPQQINQIGGIEKFLDLVASKEPILIPEFGFSDAEWDVMEKHLRDDS